MVRTALVDAAGAADLLCGSVMGAGTHVPMTLSTFGVFHTNFSVHVNWNSPTKLPFAELGLTWACITLQGTGGITEPTTHSDLRPSGLLMMKSHGT